MLPDRLNYIWRLACTGFGFIAFSLGGFLLASIVFPALILTHPNVEDRSRRFRAVLCSAFRLFLGYLDICGILRLVVDRPDRLARCTGSVVVANHPTLIDVVVLMTLVPRAQCIVKPALWRHPFLGPVMRAAGYIPNDLDGEALLARCQASLDSGDNLIIFPEGTRSRADGDTRFQRGFANIAVLTGASIQPVIISCDPPTLRKGDRWYDIPPRRVLYQFLVQDQVRPEGGNERPRAIEARRLTRQINGVFAGVVGT